MRPVDSHYSKLRRVIPALAAGVAVSLLSAGPASAISPSPAPGGAPATAAVTTTTVATGPAPLTLAQQQAKAKRIAIALENQGKQRDLLAERLDQAEIHAQQVAAHVTDTQRRLNQADAQMRAALAVVRHQAIEAYVLGGQTSFLAFSGGKRADDFVRRDAYAAVVAGAKQESLRTLGRLRHQLDQERTQLARDQQAADVAVIQIGFDRVAAAGAAAAEQATLNQVQGDMAVLVAAQQAQLAAQLRTRLMAQLPARPPAAARGGSAVPAAAVVRAPARQLPPAAVPAAQPASPQPQPQPRPSPPPQPSPQPGPRPVPPPPSPPPTAPPATRPPPPPAPPPPAGNLPAPGWQTALAAARAELGLPYQWGAAGPNSFDCSGLVMWAWAKAGVYMPHLAQAQYAMTRRIAIADLQPGDLVFYGTPSNVYHDGIYVGGGIMIDAPTTGQFVHYTTIYFSGLLAGGRV